MFETIIQDHQGVVYTDFKTDFSNIPELFNDDEKILIFNQFSVEGGFNTLTQYLSEFKNVKYLLSPYASYSGLDLELVKKLGMRYRNNAGANAKSVAQYAVTAMFNLLSRVPELGKLSAPPDGSLLGEEYHGKTAGIIGMGNVGVELLDILNGLGIETVFYNRSVKSVNAEQVPLEKVFQQDIVFITIATNPDTKKLLSNITTLVQQKNYIVDISGLDDLYDKSSLVELLNAGKIKGFALETNTAGALQSDKNLFLTPHIAWCTVDAERRTAQNLLNRTLLILNNKTAEIDFIV